MDDLKECSLDELIERVIQERLIDSCEQKEDHVIIVQGAMRFVLNPIRAHAFLRGVIRGMGSVSRRRDTHREKDPSAAPMAQNARSGLEGEPKTGFMDSFRRHLLRKYWTRYEEANCPFGRSSTALMLWVRHSTHTTTN